MQIHHKIKFFAVVALIIHSGLLFAQSTRKIKSLPTRINVVSQSNSNPFVSTGDYKWTPYTNNFPLVYVRVPKTNRGAFDSFSETGRWFSFTGPGQLVYQNEDYTQPPKIIFDCTQPQKITPESTAKYCVPIDPMVSFDGKKVIFSVVYGDIVDEDVIITPGGAFRDNGNVMARTLTNVIGARLYEIDLTHASTKTAAELRASVSPLPYRGIGDFDTGPAYVPTVNTKNNLNDYAIMFTSNRARELPSSLLGKNAAHRSFNNKVMQLYLADKTLNQIQRIGTHDRDGILHPFTLSDGRVAFTTWTLSHVQAYKKADGAARNFASPENEAWIASVDSLGGTFSAEYGRHSRNVSETWHRPKVNGQTAPFSHLYQDTVGMHFVAEVSDKKWICSADYYRSNNKGGGLITCWERMESGIEGPYAQSPSSQFALTPRYIFRPFRFGNNSDNPAGIDGVPRDPVGMPNNQIMISWLRGDSCARPDTNLSGSCDAGIYISTKIPAAATDMRKIVDESNFHEFMARPLLPYAAIYGQNAPQFKGHQKSTDQLCYIGSGSMDGDIQPLGQYSFNQKNNSAVDCAIQGCKARQRSISDVKAIRFWEVLPHDANFLSAAGQPNYLKVLTGNRLRLLGDAQLESDGSFVAQIPCEKPYVLAGVTEDGEAILRDQVPQSLRKGEIRTCKGCHLHGTDQNRGRDFWLSAAGVKLKNFNSSTIANLNTDYQEMWKGRLQKFPEGKAVYDFSMVRDILKQKIPTFNQYTGNSNGFAHISPSHEKTEFLPEKLWNILAAEEPANVAGDWHPPMLSTYIHMAFTVESPLYWMVKGTRLDGRTDGTNVNFNIDFKPLVQTPFSDNEIRIIKNWLDSGAYLHQGSRSKDYQPIGN